MQIDELVVSLLLDASGFAKGQKDAESAAQKGADALKSAAETGEKAQTGAHEAIVAGLNRLAAAMEKTGDRAEKQNKRTAEGNTKVAASFESAIRTGLTFLAVLAGARTVEQFTRQITALDAALGRTAYGMGQSPQALSAIGKAVERMGGDFNGAVGGMRALSDAYQDFRTTGSSALIEPMTRLQALSGKTVTFGKDTLATFESVADALKALDEKGEHALTDRLGRQILGSEDLTNFAKRGGPAVRADLAESERHGVVDPKDVKAAQDLQSAYVALSQSVVGLGTKIETALSPYLTKLLRQLDDLIDKHGAEWVAEFSTFLDKHKPDIEAFGKAVLDLTTAAGTVAGAFGAQSPMMVALELFAGALTVKLLKPLNLVLDALRAIARTPLTGPLAVLAGANYLADNTMSNVDPWADQSAGETALRAADPGLADRVYGKRGEQLPHGPHHGPGVKAQPHDTRTLWQRTMPKALGGQDAPEGAEPRPSPVERLRRAARRPGADTGPQSDASAPGANGFGLIDAPYRASVDRKGEGGHLSPRELFDYLKSRGATDNEATMLTGAAGSESSFNPNAVHDINGKNGPGHGLWGHNDHRINMTGLSWQQQADKALSEVKREYADRVNAARTPQELADAEMHYERPRGYHDNNPRGGDNYTGRLHTIDRFSRAFGTLGHTGGGQTAAPEKAVTDAGAAPPRPITGQERFDAQQRIIAGNPRPGDRDLITAYQRQENTPPPKPAPQAHPDDDRASRARPADGKPIPAPPAPVPHDGNPKSVTDDGIMKLQERTFKSFIGWGAHHPDELERLRGIAHPSSAMAPEAPRPLDAAHQKPADAMRGGSNGQPIKVDLTHDSTRRVGEMTVGHFGRQFFAALHRAQEATKHAAAAQRPPSLMHGHPEAMQYHRSVMAGLRTSTYNHHAVTNNIDRSSTSETKIGSLTVHTQATDAPSLAAGLDAIYQRAAAAGRRNYGQA